MWIRIVCVPGRSEIAGNSRHHVEIQHLFMNCPYIQMKSCYRTKYTNPESLKQTGTPLESPLLDLHLVLLGQQHEEWWALKNFTLSLWYTFKLYTYIYIYLMASMAQVGTLKMPSVKETKSRLHMCPQSFRVELRAGMARDGMDMKNRCQQCIMLLHIPCFPFFVGRWKHSGPQPPVQMLCTRN